MKTVFDNRMCAHVWAQQDQETGRSSNGNLHFERETIYSYRTPIGRFITRGKRRAVLVTNETHSITTSSKHMPAVRRALSADLPTFYVPDLGNQYNNPPNHRANVTALFKSIQNNVDAFARRNCVDTWRGDHISDAIQRANAYAQFFGIRRQFIMPTEDALKTRGAKLRKESSKKAAATTRKRKDARKNLAPQIEAWRNAELAQHEYPGRPLLQPTDSDKRARHIAEYKRDVQTNYRAGKGEHYEIRAYAAIIPEDDKIARRESLKDRIAEYTSGATDDLPFDVTLTPEDEDTRALSVAPRTEQWARRELDNLPKGARPTAEQAERRAGLDLQTWRNGESVYLENLNGHAFLRIRNDEIETSQHARFPIEDAKRVFPLIARCRQNSTVWIRNGEKAPIGHFQIDRITAQGDVKAGCHLVAWGEIELIARQLDLI